MSTKIHETAIVHPKAELDEDVEVGAYSIIDEHVRIGMGTKVGSNSKITGHTTIGENNRIFSSTVIGSEPQDIKFHGETTYLTIGDNNVFREFVTVNVGTAVGGGHTIIGDSNHIMACCHVAHDCTLEDNITMVNSVLLGGHVKIEKSAGIGGGAGIHHFVTIGQMSYVGGLTRVVQDVPPYMIVEGDRTQPRAVNVVGCKRNGFSEEEIEALKVAYRTIYRAGLNHHDAYAQLEQTGPMTEHVKLLIQFLRNKEKGAKGRYRESLRTDKPPKTK